MTTRERIADAALRRVAKKLAERQPLERDDSTILLGAVNDEQTRILLSVYITIAYLEAGDPQGAHQTLHALAESIRERGG